MQNLDVISVNLWDILIALINLILLFLIIKKFLFKPVQKILKQRQSEIEEQYIQAQNAVDRADEDRKLWEEKVSTADMQADAIVQNAAESARQRSEGIVADAKNRADGIIRMAQEEAELERRKAAEDIKREIVEVSGVLTEKIIGREINTEDHEDIINSFIDKIGDDND